MPPHISESCACRAGSMDLPCLCKFYSLYKSCSISLPSIFYSLRLWWLRVRSSLRRWLFCYRCAFSLYSRTCNDKRCLFAFAAVAYLHRLVLTAEKACSWQVLIFRFMRVFRAMRFCTFSNRSLSQCLRSGFSDILSVGEHSAHVIIAERIVVCLFIRLLFHSYYILLVLTKSFSVGCRRASNSNSLLPALASLRRDTAKTMSSRLCRPHGLNLAAFTSEFNFDSYRQIVCKNSLWSKRVTELADGLPLCRGKKWNFQQGKEGS